MNVTYTAADGGLVAWLNNQTARYASSTVHVTLPSGNVARGAASLRLPSGLNLILQGQGMVGVSNTTLDLERKNLDVGKMLGDGGRIEFRNMHVRNVRPSRASAAVRVLLMTPWLVCAGLCGAPARLSPTPANACAGCSLAAFSPCHVGARRQLRASCTLTRPRGPRLRSTASDGLLRGCASYVVRRRAASGIVVHACMLHRRALGVVWCALHRCIGDVQRSRSASAV